MGATRSHTRRSARSLPEGATRGAKGGPERLRLGLFLDPQRVHAPLFRVFWKARLVLIFQPAGMRAREIKAELPLGRTCDILQAALKKVQKHDIVPRVHTHTHM